MPSPIGHSIAALALGSAFAGRRAWWSTLLLGIFCANAPDLDIIAFALSIPYADLFGHRGITHSLCVAPLFGLTVTLLCHREERPGTRGWWRFACYYTLATASHGILDALTNGGLGVALFAPFDTHRYFFPWRPISVSGLGIDFLFTPRGHAVIHNELYWIGRPALGIIAVISIWRVIRWRCARRMLGSVILAGFLCCGPNGCGTSVCAKPTSNSPGPMEREAAIEALLAGAKAQIGVTKIYDPAYVRLDYPKGDVPIERGVCADVIVRAFRSAGVDLQVVVHRDMQRHFSAYPQLWGLKQPDPNIDHRRVPNLMTFFTRSKKELPASTHANDYQPGDIVAWRLPNGLLHIGLVAARTLIIHNIGAGAQQEDVLFAYEIIGHYRYF